MMMTVKKMSDFLVEDTLVVCHSNARISFEDDRKPNSIMLSHLDQPLQPSLSATDHQTAQVEIGSRSSSRINRLAKPLARRCKPSVRLNAAKKYERGYLSTF